MALVLTRAEVEPLLDLERAIQVTESAFREQAEQSVAALAPRHLAVPGGALRIVSGALLKSRSMGVRVGGAAGLAGAGMTGLLYDSEDGRLLSVMAYPFGTLRTGATIGLATRLLARPQARAVAMIGTGRNALGLLQAACHVCRLETIRIYSRSPERRAAFARKAEADLKLPVEAVSESAAAIRGADIVYIATDSLTPVLRAEWLSAGVFVASMGRPSEIDPSVYLAARRIVVGHKKHEQDYFDMGRYRHELLELVKAGKIDWGEVGELCDVVAGRAPGRASPEEIVVFKESQGGFGDIAFVKWVYERAREKGLGRELDMQG